MRLIYRTIRFFKKYNKNYYRDLFNEFQIKMENEFGKSLVNFINNSTTQDLIFLLLKCKKEQVVPDQGKGWSKYMFYKMLRDNPEMMHKTNEYMEKENKEGEEHKYNLFTKREISSAIQDYETKPKYDGLKEPERARIMLSTEINRRLQNRSIIFALFAAFIAIGISIYTIKMDIIRDKELNQVDDKFKTIQTNNENNISEINKINGEIEIIKILLLKKK